MTKEMAVDQTYRVSKQGEHQPSDLLELLSLASRRVLWIAGGFSAAINILQFTLPLYMMQVFDKVLPSGNFSTLGLLTGIAIAALAANIVLEIIRQQMMIRLGSWLEARLSVELFEAVFLNTSAAPDIRDRAFGDISLIRGFISSPLIQSFFDAPFVLLYIAVIAMLHWSIALLTFIGAVILFAIAVHYERSSSSIETRTSAATAVANTTLHGARSEADVVLSMNLMTPLRQRWLDQQLKVIAWRDHASTHSALIVSMFKGFRMILQLAALGLGAILATHGYITTGGMLAASIIAARALAPIEQSVSSWKQYIAVRGAYGRLEKLLDYRPVPTGKLADNSEDNRSGLDVENVSLTLPNQQQPVLSNISFRLEPGKLMAVVGPTGCGKSLLAQALVGLHMPSSGALIFNGSLMGSLTLNPLGGSDQLGYLSQSPRLQPGTIAQNIARFEDDPSAPAIVQASRLAGCNPMIQRLPHGYEETISLPGSIQFSSGQIQQIALARALYGKPDLVVLDEPLRNLDAESQSHVIDALSTVAGEGASVVVMTHNPRLLSRADWIIVLANGSIALQGPRSVILAHLMGEASMPETANAIRWNQRIEREDRA